ncbi:NUDIX hydrolase [Saccharopolyspora shandongensis]|uniref:NUDIX hydrolase n=1 Tax=Saccharopolyspora shandongensis TaxID=418495 RepID=UPI0033C40A6F
MNQMHAIPSEPDTADIVLFTVHDDGMSLVWPRARTRVLLVQRSWDSDAYPGALALPGGFIDDGETPMQAAYRELREETGLSAPTLTRVGRYDAPGRDPRGAVVSEAFTTVLPTMPQPTAGDDARAAFWVPLHEALSVPEVLAFDHHQILTDAHTLVRDQLNQR